MASWVRTITSPFRKACTILNISKDQKKSRKGDESHYCMNLHGEVMACAYEDVQSEGEEERVRSLRRRMADMARSSVEGEAMRVSEWERERWSRWESLQRL
ncbi:hypothetical protein QJS10_CPA05g00070 [Acorus calamus]|uniref:Uncharacterized protein n=1 Tax=Acorus calamus TaxID=4465 RepID=A0AAV9EWG4_ACOCL|nr:hypothetical protein QJS10_CPA05g00070 [Acorus calamus]